MSHTVTVRLPEDLGNWLQDIARAQGISQSQIIKDQLEKARQAASVRPFMKLAGSVRGLPRDLSQRKGYSRYWESPIRDFSRHSSAATTGTTNGL